MVRALLLSLLGALPLAVGAGCGSGSSTGTNSDFLICATETRAVPYRAGMSVLSDAGTFTVKLLSSVPGPPVKGQNSWTIEIDEVASGAARDGLVVTVMPWMPDHNHGTTTVAVTPEGAGTYGLKPVYLYMSGFWQVRLTIVDAEAAGGTTDAAVIPICIQ